MATSPLLGIDTAPAQAGGRDVEALGPSDSSDSGSDIQGERDLFADSDLENHLGITPGRTSDSDSQGTGERGAALPESDVREGGDILPDRIRSLGDEAAGLDALDTDPVDLAAIEDALADEDPDEESNEDAGRSGDDPD